MPRFQYSCFISYPHGQSDIKQRFIEEFHLALSGELGMLRNEKAFVDKERLKGGDFYNEALARALYESATLVLVYHPNYFDAEHPYCAREYRAMCALERARLALLTNARERSADSILERYRSYAEQIGTVLDKGSAWFVCCWLDPSGASLESIRNCCVVSAWDRGGPRSSSKSIGKNPM